MITGFSHLAIAVSNLEETVKKYKEILGLNFKGTEVIKGQNVRVAFFEIGGVNLEFMEPLNDNSPISSFLRKRGDGLHHLAFEVDDIRSQITDLGKQQVKMLTKEPVKGSQNTLIAFAAPKDFSGVLIEFQQKH